MAATGSFLVPLLLGLAAVTGRSFWIDECVTAEFVSQPTLALWWHDLQTTDFAEAQMPFYLGYLWAWNKVFGHGEWALRLAALPWFTLGVGTWLLTLRRLTTLGWAAVGTVITSAFLWYYLNEARLYAMQFGVTCWVAASILCLSHRNDGVERTQSRWFVLFLIGIVLLSGISIIGMIWAGAAVLILLVVQTPRGVWKQALRHPWWVGLCGAMLAALAAYYLLSVLRGARASSVATTNLQTVVYLAYELLGFTGLGPGRDALRAQGANALLPYAPWLAAYALATGAVLGAGVWNLWHSPWRLRVAGVGVALMLPTAFLLATGVLRHFRVLGRHFTPLLVVILLILALGVAWWWNKGRLGRGVAVAWLILALCSALSVRWASRHEKDDYRSAVAHASDALEIGWRVWWNAAPQGARYYGLPITTNAADADSALALFGPTQSELEQADPPDVVVVSRPDVYDHQQAMAAWLSNKSYRQTASFAGFEVWERP